MSREVERVSVVADSKKLYVEWQGDERWGVAVVPVALSEAVYVEGSAGRAVPVLRAAGAGRPARIELEKGRIVDWICRSCLLGDER